MTAPDLHREGQRKLADAQLIPLLSHDLGLVIRRQLDQHPANAELIVWLLNHARELLDVHRGAAEWVGELEEFYRAREVLDARGLSRTSQYIVGHIEARERLAEMLGWPLPGTGQWRTGEVHGPLTREQVHEIVAQEARASREPAGQRRTEAPGCTAIGIGGMGHPLSCDLPAGHVGAHAQKTADGRIALEWGSRE